MNQKQVSSIFKFLLFLTIGIFLIWLSVHKLTEKDKEDISNALQRADYRWIVLSILIGILSHWSRAIRWKMLMEPLGHKPKTSNTFFAVMVGYLANYAINRLGEVTRCGVLAKYEKVPFTESFGTVIVERLVDVLTFLVISLVVFLIQFDTAYSYLSENLLPKLSEKFSSGATFLYLFAGLFILTAFFFIFYRKRIMNLFGRKTKNFINGFIEGLKTIRRVKSPVLFIAHSIFIWFIYYITLHFCFYSLDETKDLSLGAGLTTFLISTLAVMITPGGLGAVPIAIASVLTFYKIDFSIGTAIGWIAWLGSFVAILFLGLLSLVLLPMLNKEAKSA